MTFLLDNKRQLEKHQEFIGSFSHWQKDGEKQSNGRLEEQETVQGAGGGGNLEWYN